MYTRASLLKEVIFLPSQTLSVVPGMFINLFFFHGEMLTGSVWCPSLQVTTALVRSWLQWPCHVQKNSSDAHLAILWFFCFFRLLFGDISYALECWHSRQFRVSTIAFLLHSTLTSSCYLKLIWWWWIAALIYGYKPEHLQINFNLFISSSLMFL